MSASELEQFLVSHPVASASDEVQAIINPKVWDEKQYDRERKARQRAKGRELDIPPPKDIPRRMACLNDPKLLLNTYFKGTYFEPFTDDRSDMLKSIWRAARYGGDQAIAAPRGEGKTTLAMDGSFTLLLAGLTFFPVIIGKNQDAASDELKALRERISASEEFVDDFPEIGIPLQSVGASTANARLQTVGGKFVGMYLGVKHFALPNIPTELLRWPDGVDSVARGQVIGAVGIDGRIRGFKFRSERPTLAIIDDIEDKHSAKNDLTISQNEQTIEEDIGGMGSSAERIARVYLCTTLNRKCNAYKYTDPKQKPSFRGKRYRKMLKRPDRMDLVDEYVEMRRNRSDDDPDAREAFRYWRDNQGVIEAGCEISNPHSHSKKLHEDGEPLELSAIQAYFNRVADWGEKAVATEVDNDPPEETGPTGAGLTADVVSSRLSGLARYQAPANATALTAAIDIGKYRCHWVVIAWWKGAGGCVVDYGIQEVTGNENINTGDRAADMVASEPAIFRALLDFRDSLLAKQYVDSAGAVRSVDCVMVDSGTYTNAAYEFVRQVRGVFHPSKGIANYRPRSKSTKECRAGKNQHAQFMASSGVWLYELDTDWWKQWVHERFLTPCFDENNMLRRGSLSLFEIEGKRRHTTFAQHIVSEELLTEFKEGKGSKTYWYQHNENNHFLDATYMAAAGTESVGIGLLQPSEIAIAPTHVNSDKPKQKKQPQQRRHGMPKQRAGGWIKGLRNRR
jgi:hypothetical protein